MANNEVDDWEDIPTSSNEAGADDWEDITPVPEKSFGESARDFGRSMIRGSSIGENLPLVGKPIAQAGTMIGSGLQALTEAPFSEGTISDLYKRNMALSEQAEAERAAIDERSPAAQMTKTALASAAAGPLKRPAPIDPFAKPGSWAARFGAAEKEAAEAAAQQGKFSYPADTAKEKLMEYFGRMGSGEGKIGEFARKAAPFAKDAAEELLPAPLRFGLRAYRRFKD